jgi:glycosyltransferase involved in cell wall biosynthesis
MKKKALYIRDYPASDDYGYDYDAMFDNSFERWGAKDVQGNLSRRLELLAITGLYDWRVLLLLLTNRAEVVFIFPFASLQPKTLRLYDPRTVVKLIYQVLVFMIIFSRKKIFVHEFDSDVTGIFHRLISRKVFFYQLPFKNEVGSNYEDRLPNRLVFNGRLDVYQKGLDVLVSNFQLFKKLVPSTELTLEISGIEPPENRYKKAYENFVNNIGTYSAVKFSGAMSVDERLHFLKDKNSFLIYPSRSDGTARPIRSALENSKPLIISTGTGLGHWPLGNNKLLFVNNSYSNSYLQCFYTLDFLAKKNINTLSPEFIRKLVLFNYEVARNRL